MTLLDDHEEYLSLYFLENGCSFYMFLLLLRQKVAWSLLGSQLTVHRKIYVNINVYIEIHKEKYTYRHNKTKYRQAGKTRG